MDETASLSAGVSSGEKIDQVVPAEAKHTGDVGRAVPADATTADEQSQSNGAQQPEQQQQRQEVTEATDNTATTPDTANVPGPEPGPDATKDPSPAAVQQTPHHGLFVSPASFKLEECLAEPPGLLSAFTVFAKEAEAIKDYTSMLIGDCNRVHRNLDLSSKSIASLAQQLAAFQKLSADHLVFSPVIPPSGPEAPSVVSLNPLVPFSEATLPAQLASLAQTPSPPSPPASQPSASVPFLYGQDESFEKAMAKFSQTLFETHTWQELHSSQLVSVVVQPLNRFLQQDMKDIKTIRSRLEEAAAEHEAACQRYARVSKKKETERARFEANAELYAARKKYHLACLDYYTKMRESQHSRKMALLEPLLAYMHAQMSFFQMGFNYFQQQVKPFLGVLNAELQQCRQVAAKDSEAMERHKEYVVQEYASLCNSVSPDPDDPFAEYSPPNTALKAKQGYLLLRTNKIGKNGRKWDRLYFFTESDQLYYYDENKEKRLATKLNQAAALMYELDDRRYCFSIVTPSSVKRPWVLQAENDREREEWMCLVQNVARDLRASGEDGASQEASEDDTSPSISKQSSSNDLLRTNLSHSSSVEKDMHSLDVPEETQSSGTASPAHSPAVSLPFSIATARLKSLDALFGRGKDQQPDASSGGLSSSSPSLTTSSSSSSLSSFSSSLSPAGATAQSSGLAPSASAGSIGKASSLKSIFKINAEPEVNPFMDTVPGTDPSANSSLLSVLSSSSSSTVSTPEPGLPPGFSSTPSPNSVAVPDDKGGVLYISEKQQFSVGFWGSLEIIPADAPASFPGPRSVADVVKVLVPKFGLLSQRKARSVILSLGIDSFQVNEGPSVSRFELRRVIQVGVDATNKRLFVITVFGDNSYEPLPSGGLKSTAKQFCNVFETASPATALHLSTIAGTYFRAAYKRAIETGQLLPSPQSQAQLARLENAVLPRADDSSAAPQPSQSPLPTPPARLPKPNVVASSAAHHQPPPKPAPFASTHSPGTGAKRSAPLSASLATAVPSVPVASKPSLPRTSLLDDADDEEPRLVDRRQSLLGGSLAEAAGAGAPSASVEAATGSQLLSEASDFLDELSDEESAQEMI